MSLLSDVDPTGGLVLIVDDDVEVTDATAFLLNMVGYTVLTASNSGEAIEQVYVYGRTPDLVLCGFHLNGSETGIAAIKAIREETKERLPAILVTGDTSAWISELNQEVEDCHLLKKPVDCDHLLILIGQLI